MKCSIVCLLVCLLSVLGCTEGSHLIQKGIMHVKAASEKPKDCRSLGKVNGVSMSGKKGTLAQYKESLKDIKRSVSSVGGNYLHIQKIIRDGEMISGDAYLCDN